MKSDPTPDTVEIVVPAANAEPAPAPIPSSRVEAIMGGLSHQGKVRANNEDNYLVVRFGRSLHTVLTNLAEEFSLPDHQEIGYGMLIADGMGGMAAGEVASRSAIQTFGQLVRDTPDWIFGLDESLGEMVMTRMAARFREIDRVLIQSARANPDYAGMGTTLTLTCSLGLDLVICHIGDSRAYLFRDGRLRQLTRDMTAAQDLIDAGLLNPAAAAARRLRNVLTQCLGGGNALADVHHETLQDKDRLLLCSDGLTEMLDDAQIVEVLSSVATSANACHELVQRALQAGGRDNVTVVLADYQVT